MRLNVFRGNELIANIDLKKDIFDSEGITVFYLGRSSNNHIVLDDVQISRDFGRIEHKKNTWKIFNESPYGSLLINGAPYIEKILVDGDIITIGPFILQPVFSPMASEEESPPTSSKVPSKEASSVSTFAESLEDNAIDADLGLNPNTTNKTEKNGPLGDTDNSEISLSKDAAEQSSPTTNFPTEANEDNLESEFKTTSTENGIPEVGAIENEIITDGDKTQLFKTFATFELEIFGEFAPYDKYAIEDGETFIGRNPNKCKIVLNDVEVSGIHSKIVKSGSTCFLVDLQSANGTLLNGERINKAELANADEFIIGSTTFTFKVSSKIISEEKNRFMPVEDNQFVEVEEIVEVGTDFADELADTATASNENNALSFLKKIGVKRLVMYGSLLFLVLLLFIPTEEKKTLSATTKDGKNISNTTAESDSNANTNEKKSKQQKEYSRPELEELESNYLLAKDLINSGKYQEALMYLERIKIITNNESYKESRMLFDTATQGLAQLEELEKKRREDEARQARQKKIDSLIEKAQEAVEKKEVNLAESIFTEVMSLDPENSDIPRLKNELEYWKREQERIAMEEAAKKAERNRKEKLLAPGRDFFLKKEWYSAIIKLQQFLRLSDMDPDLTAEAAKMLSESEENLNSIVAPLIGKARSLKEGQDLKGAYEHYAKTLAYDKSNIEALDAMNEIYEILSKRAKKIYQEALVSESLSLFDDAKDKFKEVQQISPTDSPYYKKATNKLQSYPE